MVRCQGKTAKQFHLDKMKLGVNVFIFLEKVSPIIDNRTSNDIKTVSIA